MIHVAEFAGRLHPLLVHLPIGIIFITILLVWIRQRISVQPGVIQFLIGVSAITAILSSTTGYLLSVSVEYSGETVQWHKWMGISLAVLTTTWWFIHRRSSGEESISKISSLVVLIVLLTTGHLGGSLTHGSDYLNEPLMALIEGEPSSFDLATINPDSSVFYGDVVALILKENCYRCHGPDKQKGQLRLDSKQSILKGGKDGPAVEISNSTESQLLQRILLPLSDEDHMPPKEKRQLSVQEITLLKIWIDHKADFEKPMLSIISREEIEELIASGKEAITSDFPTDDPGVPDQSTMERLTNSGISISPVSRESNFLQVNFVSASGSVDSLLAAMKPVASQVIWLKLSGSELTDKSIKNLEDFQNLTRLSLDHTGITDESLKSIGQLKHLQYLDLKGTQITAESLHVLKELSKLKQLILFQTPIPIAKRQSVEQDLKSTHIEWGGYEVPALPTDTMIVRSKK